MTGSHKGAYDEIVKSGNYHTRQVLMLAFCGSWIIVCTSSMMWQEVIKAYMMESFSCKKWELSHLTPLPSPYVGLFWFLDHRCVHLLFGKFSCLPSSVKQNMQACAELVSAGAINRTLLRGLFEKYAFYQSILTMPVCAWFDVWLQLRKEPEPREGFIIESLCCFPVHKQCQTARSK